MLPLDRLDNERLGIRVVDLTFIMIQDAMGLVLHLRLVITRLRKNNDLNVLGGVTTSLEHIFLRMGRSAFTDYNTT